MKKLLTFCFSLLIAAGIFAEDGIQFNHGSWQEVLARAKKENKLVFIDVFTSWCGPCKMMVAEVFPKKEVGDLFNASFINYKIDAEKGEGIKIANQFNVRAYPTYLFVNGDGQLIYRTSGYMPVASFLQEANIAIKEKDDPKPLVKWEAEYNQGKRSSEFLAGYMKKRALLKLPSAEIAEELFPLLTKQELKDRELLSAIIYPDPNIQFVPGGRVFSFVMDNHKELDSLKIVRYPLGALEMGINNYFRKKIIEGKKEKMLPVMINAYRRIMKAAGAAQPDITVMEKELPVKYYSGTGNEAKLNPAVGDLVRNGIMKLDIAGKQASDAESFAKFMEPYLSGKADSTKDEKFTSKRLMKNRSMVNISYKLRDAVEAVYNISKDKAILKQAADWARMANDWFPHFSSSAVYSGLLFKTGHQQQAILLMEAAAQDPFLSNGQEVQNLLLSNLEKMKKGEAPKTLWKLQK